MSACRQMGSILVLALLAVRPDLAVADPPHPSEASWLVARDQEPASTRPEWLSEQETPWPRPEAAWPAAAWEREVSLRAACFLGSLAVGGLALTMWARRQARTDRGPAVAISCLGAQRIAGRSSLAVFEVQQQHFLVAHDPSGIRCVVPLERPFDETLDTTVGDRQRAPSLHSVSRADLPSDQHMISEDISWEPNTRRW